MLCQTPSVVATGIRDFTLFYTISSLLVDDLNENKTDLRQTISRSLSVYVPFPTYVTNFGTKKRSPPRYVQNSDKDLRFVLPHIGKHRVPVW